MKGRIAATPWRVAFVLVAFLSQAPTTLAQSAQRIQFVQLQSMFSEMRAKAPWDVDGPLLWGYFFLDPSAARLRRAAAELLAAGYRVVSVREVPGDGQFRLHVEKVEVHSPESLHKRNSELYALAEKYGIASYDGMDVGPAGK